MAPGARRTAAPRRTLLLRGAAGSTPAVEFKVSNPLERSRVEVSFEISEFVSEDGRPAVRGGVDVTPARFTLEQGEERTVFCSIRLPQHFELGTRYLGLLRVIGFDDLSVGLVVELAPPSPNPDDTDEAGDEGLSGAGADQRPEQDTESTDA